MAQETDWESSAHRRDFLRDEAMVQEFLDGFAHAITAGDTRAIAAMWEAPALVLSDPEVHAVGSLGELEGFFSGNKARYNSRGITDTRADIVRLHWVTQRMVIVEVRWPHLDSQGDEVGEETSTYTLRRDGSGKLKLRVAVMHGASTRH